MILQNLKTTLRFFKRRFFKNNLDFFVYMKLQISKREEIVNVLTVNSFKAKLKSNGLVVALSNYNK